MQKAILDDTKQPIATRREAAEIIKDEMMNPADDASFNPDTFDPMEGVKNHSVIKRNRVVPPRRLPNIHGLKPKEIMDGQMVGMFESKQDLYLLIYALAERLADVEDQLGQ